MYCSIILPYTHPISLPPNYPPQHTCRYCLTPQPITVLGAAGKSTSLYRVSRKLLVADGLAEADAVQKRQENPDPSLPTFCDMWFIGDHSDSRLVKVDGTGKADEGFEGMNDRGGSEGNFWHLNRNGFIRFRTTLPQRYEYNIPLHIYIHIYTYNIYI